MNTADANASSAAPVDWAALTTAIENACGGPGRIREFNADEPVFHAGDRVRHLFIVERGRVALQRHARGGTILTLHVAEATSGLAEASLFASRYHCDAVAISAATLRVFPKPALIDALRDDPAFSLLYTAHLARQVQLLRGRIELLNEPSARARLLTFLRGCSCDTDGIVRLSGTWKQLASQIGLTHEAVYRALRLLEREGRIERPSARCVRLLRPSAARSA